ncbi:hypothetical protein O4J56_09765 [Nocardiopsis sp. RSe5-2]|uniref:Alpha/beta hydrolase n=1 Tax=Nocardiopsis endophytica TaxID=3018445 RepID=A0ABT4U2L1_9ACTN|nr:hypothetical protein [Nocardiopsis endophytica]MDA2810921.1 hypothetical protein [Nocardiopsis endophytica]
MNGSSAPGTSRGHGPAHRPSGRPDVLVCRIRSATTAGRTGAAARLAARLAEAAPEVQGWCDYVAAGCRSLEGDPQAALAMLDRSEQDGGWWADALLDDASLRPVWELPGAPELRERVARRYAPVAAAARPRRVWLQRPERPQAAVVALHGNGPLPIGLLARLWRELPGVAVLAVRSGALIAPDVAVWRGGEEAVRTVSEGVDEARGAVPQAPLAVVGLGAGAGLASRVAVRRSGAVAGAVAVAPVLPAQGPYPDAEADASRPAPRVLVLGDGEDGSQAGIDGYADWARGRGVDVRMWHRPGLGHAFPAEFGPDMGEALRLVLEGAPASADRAAGGTGLQGAFGPGTEASG